MFIPVQIFFFLMLFESGSMQEQVLEADLTLNSDNAIVSVASTLMSNRLSHTATATATWSDGTKTNSITEGIIQSKITVSEMVDDLWNILDGSIDSKKTESTTNIKNNVEQANQQINIKKEPLLELIKKPEQTVKIENDVSKVSKPSLYDENEMKMKIKKEIIKEIQRQKNKMNERDSNVTENHRIHPKRKNIIYSVDSEDIYENWEPKKYKTNKNKHCPIKKNRKTAKRKKLKVSSCNVVPLSSKLKLHTLHPKTKTNACLIEQTVVIPPQQITIPTIPPPIYSVFSTYTANITSKISSWINYNYTNNDNNDNDDDVDVVTVQNYTYITKYAGTRTATLTQLSIIPFLTTNIQTSTTTIFTPTTQIVYEAIYTPFTVTTTATDTAYMVKVKTVCKGSPGCNACELDAYGMVLPAARLPAGIFATPINQIDTRYYDIMGYVGVNPSSFRAEMQEYYSTTLPLTRPIFSHISTFLSEYRTTTTSTKKDNDNHHHRRRPFKKLIKKIKKKVK